MNRQAEQQTIEELDELFDDLSEESMMTTIEEIDNELKDDPYHKLMVEKKVDDECREYFEKTAHDYLGIEYTRPDVCYALENGKLVSKPAPPLTPFEMSFIKKQD